jgi:iron complex outermembrane receptor protein
MRQPLFRLRRKTLCLSLLAALPALAQAADPALDPAGAPPMAIVAVTGTGQSRQVQNITRADLQQATPGTSPLKTLEKLPGVSFQSADPFGSYEWSTRFSIRGRCSLPCRASCKNSGLVRQRHRRSAAFRGHALHHG